MYDSLSGFIKFLMILFVLCVPLGVWKAIEIIVSIVNHVSISIV